MKETGVLVVDDDPSVRKFLRANLEARDYQVWLATDGEEALEVIEKELPDLIVLDITMPNMDGFEVCRRVREWCKIPIIMLSAREGETDKINCLDAGADDYLTKPFSLKELLSRIKAVLRRGQGDDSRTEQTSFQNGELQVDFTRHVVTLSDQIIDLTAIEYKIIAYLTANARRIITTDQLLEKVWGEDSFGDSRMIQVHICRLRRKLKDNAKNPKYIQTRPGTGYMVLNPH